MNSQVSAVAGLLGPPTGAGLCKSGFEFDQMTIQPSLVDTVIGVTDGSVFFGSVLIVTNRSVTVGVPGRRSGAKSKPEAAASALFSSIAGTELAGGVSDVRYSP